MAGRLIVMPHSFSGGQESPTVLPHKNLRPYKKFYGPAKKSTDVVLLVTPEGSAYGELTIW